MPLSNVVNLVVFEHMRIGLLARGKALVMDCFDLQVWIPLSMAALSKEPPFLLMRHGRPWPLSARR